MDTARQVIRWTVPGWLLIMFFSMFTIVKDIILGKTLAEIIELVPLPAFSFAGLLVMGLPLGYLIYQIYYRGMHLTPLITICCAPRIKCDLHIVGTGVKWIPQNILLGVLESTSL